MAVPQPDSVLSDRWGVLSFVVAARMAALDLDQRSVAACAGVSASVVGDLRHGRPKRYELATLQAVALALGLHPLGLIAVLAGDDAAESVGVPTGDFQAPSEPSTPISTVA